MIDILIYGLNIAALVLIAVIHALRYLGDHERQRAARSEMMKARDGYRDALEEEVAEHGRLALAVAGAISIARNPAGLDDPLNTLRKMLDEALSRSVGATASDRDQRLVPGHCNCSIQPCPFHRIDTRQPQPEGVTPGDCAKCHGRGWYPAFEGDQEYCDCPAVDAAKARVRAAYVNAGVREAHRDAATTGAS